MNKSIILALAIAAAASAWILSGVLTEDGATGATPPAASADVRDERVVRVRTQVYQADLAENRLTVQGVTRPARAVDVRAETSGRVVEIPAAKGSQVSKGDPLIVLDMGDRQARLQRAEALVEQRRLEHNAASSLASREFATRTRLAEAEANLRAAQAELAQINEEIANVTIRAPFDGVFNDRTVSEGDYVSAGTAVATVVDLDPIKVEAQVSERDVNHVANGQHGTVRLLDGRTLDSIVTWVSQTAHPATRTYAVEAEVANPAIDIPVGMTAELRLPLEATQAHLVSPAVLTLNDAGVLGVRAVDGNARVQFHPVQIVGDGERGVWLAGLPPTVEIITVGQEYVKEGQTVEPVRAENGDAAPTASAATMSQAGIRPATE